jgi:hypothetical protein
MTNPNHLKAGLSTQWAVVIGVSVVGTVALVIGLAVFAKMSDGAIVGLIGGIGAVLVNLIVVIRGQQKAAEALEHQDVKLEKIEKNTNGLSERERQDIAIRTAEEVLARYLARDAGGRNG